MFVSIACCGDELMNLKVLYPKIHFHWAFFRYNLQRRIPEKCRWRLCCVMIFITKKSERSKSLFCWHWSIWNFCAICIVTWGNSKRFRRVLTFRSLGQCHINKRASVVPQEIPWPRCLIFRIHSNLNGLNPAVYLERRQRRIHIGGLSDLLTL